MSMDELQIDELKDSHDELLAMIMMDLIAARDDLLSNNSAHCEERLRNIIQSIKMQREQIKT